MSTNREMTNRTISVINIITKNEGIIIAITIVLLRSPASAFGSVSFAIFHTRQDSRLPFDV